MGDQVKGSGYTGTTGYIWKEGVYRSGIDRWPVWLILRYIIRYLGLAFVFWIFSVGMKVGVFPSLFIRWVC